MENTLYEKLMRYRESDYYGFHMPGHKRNETLTGAILPYGIDITEIEGFDDLHHAGGILKQAQERAANVYKAEESHYLVNGSTAGILSAILGCTQKGDSILVARNCHKSVYHAIFLNELHAEYVYPQYLKEQELNGEIYAQDVRKILQENCDSQGKRIRAVVIVSPTYDGVVSNVRAIAETVHEYGIPLIVDEAHGAHFGFHPYFPQNANALGADVVIHSLHKTLPSLTQTALIHMNGKLADRERIRLYLDMLQSSSPSYVLMASMDECVNLLETRGRTLFNPYVENLRSIRDRLRKLHCLHLEETEKYDYSKLVISTRGTARKEHRQGEKEYEWGGKELCHILLEKYHLQPEMAAGSYVIAMTSVGDTTEGMERLVKALFEIDRELKKENRPGGVSESFSLPRLEQVYTSCEAEALKKNSAEKSWDCCVGAVSLEYAYLYPPGIPLIVPGERVSQEVTERLKQYERMGFSVEGTKEEGKLRVLESSL